MDNVLHSSIITGYFPVWILMTFLFSAYVSYKSYPIIIKISQLKSLINAPRKRCVHKDKISNLGGVGMFIGIVTVLTLFGSILGNNDLLCLLGALTLIFFTGLRDDLIEITPLKKLIGQVIASLAVILITDIRLHSLYGIFGITELSYLASTLVTLFVFIFIINAMNLIDGVDGLAGGIGLTISLMMGIFFFLNGNNSMLFISVSLIGVLITFLRFNFSRKQKIFMGDTGSMIIGFLLAYQGVFLIESTSTIDMLGFYNKPIFIITLFSFPLMDTTRVFIIRILDKRSPFSADKNHIHHKLLELGFKHIEIMVLASIFSCLSACLVLFFNDLNINITLCIVVTNGILFSVLPSVLLRLQRATYLIFSNISLERKTSVNG